MYAVAVLLAGATGLFYAAGTDGLWRDPVCVYGSMFCEHPSWVGAAAILALLWAKFVSI